MNALICPCQLLFPNRLLLSMNTILLIFLIPSILLFWTIRSHFFYVIKRRIRLHHLNILSKPVHYIIPGILMIIAFIVLMIPPFIHYGFGTPLVGHSYVDLSFTIRDLIAGIVFMIGISLLIRPSIPKLSK